MGAKTFHSIYDFVRHGMNLQLDCGAGHCRHAGIVAPYDAYVWFKLHRWSDAFDAGALRHFRCSRCGHRAGRARPTECAVTVTGFFPADQRGWEMLKRRLRG